MTPLSGQAAPVVDPGPAGLCGRTVGYAPGVFDLFHVGHLNILRRARLLCDHLIAGVVSDNVALQQKGRHPVVPEQERLEIVSSVRYVDETVLELTTDKIATWRAVGFEVIFKGSDWQGSQKWSRLEKEFSQLGVRVVYLPYTEHLSSSALRDVVGMRGPTTGGGPLAF